MTDTWYLRDLPGVAHGPGVRRALSLEPGGAVAWSPLELPALAVWISPNGTGTLRGEPSGDPFTGSFTEGYATLTGNGDTAVFVAQADDLSGNGFHAVQPTAAEQPELVHDGTRLVFRRTVIDQRLRILENTGLGALMSGHPYTLILGQRLSSVVNAFWFSSDHADGGTADFSRIHIGYHTTNSIRFSHWGGDHDTPVTPDTDWHVSTSQYRHPGCALRFDGTSIDSSSSNPPDLDEVGTITLGDFFGATFRGDMTELILCAGHADAELGTADIEAAEAYIDEQGSLGVL